MHDFPGALDDARRSLELSPNFSWGFGALRQALICLERANEAVEALEKAVELSHKDPWKAYHIDKLARARFLAGDLDGALADVDSLISAHPGVWTQYQLKAAILDQLGDRTGADLARKTSQSLCQKPHILIDKLPLPKRYRLLLGD